MNLELQLNLIVVRISVFGLLRTEYETVVIKLESLLI